MQYVHCTSIYAKLWIIADNTCSDAALCFAFAILHKAYGCHSLHWAALDNTEGVVCYAVIPLLCGQCTDIRKVSLRRTFADYDVADVIAFAI